MNKIEKKIKLLQKSLIYHNYLYFCLGKPVISDHEYDILFNKLKLLEKKYKKIYFSSPTRTIGSKIFSKLSLNKHLTPMLSLENVFTEKKFLNFYTKILKYKNEFLVNFVCELKLDGIAVNLIYKNGVLRKASTRGDGEKGEDITQNIFFVKSIPIKINGKNIPKLMEIRGEVLILKKDFIKLNKKNSFLKRNKFSSARNLASGSLLQKNFLNLKNRKLFFICHGFEVFNFFLDNSYYNILLKIKKWGFNISEKIIYSSSIKKILKFYSQIKNERFLLNYDVDGIVIKVDDLKLRKKLGVRSRSPRWAIAYKFPNQEKKTILKKVTFHVGRTGSITPVAHFVPVKISGITIKKASLHNKFFLDKLNLHINDRIFVCRAGDVIPQVVRKETINTKKRLIRIHFPEKCPSCRSFLEITSKSKKNFCTNYFFCLEQIKKRLVYFFSKTSFKIKDLGPNIINQLVDKMGFRNPIDFFGLDFHTLNNLKNVGKKFSKNILTSFKKFKSINLDKFILSFGIHGVGQVVSKKIAKNFKNLNKILDLKEEDLIEVCGIGKKITKNFINFIQNKNNRNIIFKLINNYNIHVKSYKKKDKNNKKFSFFLNKTILITGVFKDFSRKVLCNKLKNLGAEIKKSISKKVNLVIQGKNPGKKIFYAKKLGIKIIKENDFLKKISKN
ncbi:NAD-dependent DNA ligase LigA [Buchnera aphidicola]|uniref:NAD-dependent DNA ligase LigA n=1 Tax=Buchnera aphidicola TaxID=9 RepID=UPI003464B65F